LVLLKEILSPNSTKGRRKKMPYKLIIVDDEENIRTLIKEELEEKKAKRLELQGELKSLMNQLKELGVNSLEEAEEMIHQMEKELEEIRESIEEQIEQIEELMEGGEEDD